MRVVGLVAKPSQRKRDREIMLRAEVAEAAKQQLEKEIAERKQAEEALAKSEAKFRSLIQNSSDIITLLKADGTVLYKSPSAERVTGNKPEDLIGKNVFESIHPDDVANVIDAFNDLVQHPGKTLCVEFRFPRKDGSWCFLESTGSNLLDDPSVESIVINSRDITERKRDREIMLRAEVAEAAKQQLEKEIAERKQAEEALAKSEAKFRSLIQNSSDIITLLKADGTVLYESPSVEKIVGFKPEDLVGKSVFEFIHPDDVANVINSFNAVIQTPGIILTAKEFRFLRKDGSWCFLESTGSNLLNNPSVRSVVINSRDITERKQAEAALRQAEEKYRSIFENIVEGIFQSTPSGCFASVNPSLARIFGYDSPEELIASITDIGQQLYVEPNRHAEFLRLLRTRGSVSKFESQVYRKDGSVIWVSENARIVYDENAMLRYYEGSVEDITERKWAEEQLRHNALYDGLTDLANRTLFMNQLEQALKQAKRHNDYVFAVLFLDLDRFKVINDSLGHAIGDQLLIAVSRRLETCLREVDLVARFGGDEFAILLDDIKEVNDAICVAERIKKALTLSFNLSGREVFSSVSIGIAVSTTGYHQPDDLLRDADTALYRAKALGKARYEVFDADMHTHAVALLQLETDLRQSIKRQELQIHYQPIISVEASRIVGFEALVRWHHPQRGLVFPTEFIPIAEETGLIVPIGWWMLREACRQMHVWQTQSPVTLPLAISVNLSVKQFTQPGLIEQVDQILGEANLDAGNLRLEITESVLIENPTSATAILSQLIGLGVQLYMDDFGTGYSSLSYLHRFPVSALKIDRSFVSRMSLGDKNSEIVRAIITLASALEIDVIAEGVETVEQLAQLSALKCKYAQGYLFAKPMDAEAAGALIKKNPQWYWR